MTDRELLERAACAAGIAHEGLRERSHEGGGCGLRLAGTMTLWNPLTDDGDALRLAVRLQLTICNEHLSCGEAYCESAGNVIAKELSGTAADSEVIPADYAATRRAIVRAAAAMRHVR